MEFFERAITVCMQGHHGKFLWASDDYKTVSQERDTSNRAIVWTVEHVSGSNAIRLRSCYGLYLMASDHAYLLGMTGKKVVQSHASKADSLVEWEPTSEGSTVKLKTRAGSYLRANGGVPPWRNSVTHDVPVAFATSDWILWKVEVLKVMQPQSPIEAVPPQGSEVDLSVESEPVSPLGAQSSFDDDRTMLPRVSPRRQTPNPDVRRIFYTVANDTGEATALDDDEWGSFLFKGHSLKHLNEQLQMETGIEDDIFLCTRHPLTAKLYPMKLDLPPNNAPLHVVLVRASSSAGRTYSRSLNFWQGPDDDE